MLLFETVLKIYHHQENITINNLKHVSKLNSKAIVTLSNDLQHQGLWLLQDSTSTYVGVDVNDKERYNV